jgi:hypothetical protein
VANGLAAGRADARTMAALRRGQAVNAAATAAQLTAVLGIDTPHVREKGYVLTGLPRYRDYHAVLPLSSESYNIDMTLVLFYSMWGVSNVQYSIYIPIFF